MPIDLYYLNPSPPCRSVLLTAKAVGVSLNLKPIDLFARDQMKPEFIAINPQHTVPTMVDGHIKLWESRAICSYLASQYGKDDALYPSNPKARCVVDQRLYFDMGTLMDRWGKYVFPVMGGAPPDSSKLEPVKEALGWLNDVLKEYPWVAGNKMTIADFALVATVASIEEVGAIELDDYTRIQKWLQKCKKQMVGYQEANGEGAKIYGDFIRGKINEHKNKEVAKDIDSD